MKLLWTGLEKLVLVGAQRFLKLLLKSVGTADELGGLFQFGRAGAGRADAVGAFSARRVELAERSCHVSLSGRKAKKKELKSDDIHNLYDQLLVLQFHFCSISQRCLSS